MAALNALVSDAVDLVVHTERGASGPQVASVLAVEDLTAGVESVQFTTTELFRRDGAELAPTGEVPVRAGERMRRAGIEVRDVLGVAAGDRHGFGEPRR
jgi:pilus assembly protein CpaF